MTDHWARETPCQDVAGRPRLLRVFVDDDGTIGLFVPPGEVARFVDAVEIEALQSQLMAATVEATHRKGGRS